MADKSRGTLLGSRLVLGAVLGLLGLITTAGLGCGGNGNDLNQFTGTWQYTVSQGDLSCPGQDTQGVLGTSLKWGAGVSSDLIDLSPHLFDSNTQCLYAFDVMDKIATIQAGQTCNLSDGNGGIVEEQPTTWTFTLNSATTAEEKFTTAIALDATTSCTFTGLGTLKKVATDN